jgi:hypothetical protein
MIKKLEIKVNEKGEITSPSYQEIVSKINELIDKRNYEEELR